MRTRSSGLPILGVITLALALFAGWRFVQGWDDGQIIATRGRLVDWVQDPVTYVFFMGLHLLGALMFAGVSSFLFSTARLDREAEALLTRSLTMRAELDHGVRRSLNNL